MSAEELPPGWVEIELGEVTHSLKNGLYKPAEDYGPGGTATLRMYNIADGELVMRDVTVVRLSRQEIEDYGLRDGDIIVNRVNSPELVGKSALIPAGMGPLAFESKNIRIRLSHVVTPSFINQLLRTQAARDHFKSGTKQTTGMATISQPTLTSMPLLLPPLNEQRRIVAKLDELRARSRKAREALDEVPALLDKLKQSVLAAAFRGDLTAEWRALQPPGSMEPASVLLDRIRAERRKRWEQANPKKKYVEPEPVDTQNVSPILEPALPNTWTTTSMCTVATLATGKTPSTDEGRFWGGSIPFITPSQIHRDGSILDAAKHVTTAGACQGHLLGPGAVLLVCIGTVGKAGLLDREAVFNQQINAAVPARWIDNGYFFRWCQFLRPWIEQSASATVNAAILNKSRLERAPVRLPPQAEQVEIAKRVSAIFSILVNIEQEQGQLAADLASLDQSILAKAFRGELVPQDPNDEPAEKLLARIKTEAREGGGSKTSARGRKANGGRA